MEPRHTNADPDFTAARLPGSGLSVILALHCAHSDTAYAALLEESGISYADAGDESLRDHGETAALATGAYHATREVARRLGESNFEGLCHEGGERHFYISPVDQRFLLLSVFGNDTKLAIVRATASRTAVALREALAGGATPEMPSGRSTHDGDFQITSDYFLAMP